MLTVVVEKLPNPQEISDERVEKLMCSGLRTFDSLPEETQRLKNGECFLYLSLSLFWIMDDGLIKIMDTYGLRRFEGILQVFFKC